MRHVLEERAEGTLGTLHAEETYLQLIYHFPVSERAAEMLVRPEKPAPLEFNIQRKIGKLNGPSLHAQNLRLNLLWLLEDWRSRRWKPRS
jgi:hypothetical protein